MPFFEIEGHPISTNASLMAVNGRLIHTAKARAFKASTELALDNQLKQHLRVNTALSDELRAMEDMPLICTIKVYGNWSTKQGKIKKADICNKEKLLVDSLITVLNDNNFNLDDSQFYCVILQKLYSDVDKTVIMIETLKKAVA